MRHTPHKSPTKHNTANDSKTSFVSTKVEELLQNTVSDMQASLQPTLKKYSSQNKLNNLLRTEVSFEQFVLDYQKALNDFKNEKQINNALTSIQNHYLGFNFLMNIAQAAKQDRLLFEAMYPNLESLRNNAFSLQSQIEEKEEELKQIQITSAKVLEDLKSEKILLEQEMSKLLAEKFTLTVANQVAQQRSTELQNSITTLEEKNNAAQATALKLERQILELETKISTKEQELIDKTKEFAKKLLKKQTKIGKLKDELNLSQKAINASKLQISQLEASLNESRISLDNGFTHDIKNTSAQPVLFTELAAEDKRKQQEQQQVIKNNLISVIGNTRYKLLKTCENKGQESQCPDWLKTQLRNLSFLLLIQINKTGGEVLTLHQNSENKIEGLVENCQLNSEQQAIWKQFLAVLKKQLDTKDRRINLNAIQSAQKFESYKSLLKKNVSNDSFKLFTAENKDLYLTAISQLKEISVLNVVQEQENRPPLGMVHNG